MGLQRHAAVRAVTVRPLAARDRDRVAAGFSQLGPRSRYLRWGRPRVGPEEAVGWLLDLDGLFRFALGACSRPPAGPVGLARWVVDSPGRAEIAVTVVDAWQGRGVGTALLGELVSHARRCGLCELHASVRRDNEPALRLMRAFGGRTLAVEGGTVELSAALDPLAGAASPRAGA